MSDVRPAFLQERLELALEALNRIPGRFADIAEPADFVKDSTGQEHMDSICMVLIAAGEEFKRLDRLTEGKLFAQYSQIEWRGAIGLRDVLAHAYFQADPEQIYNICHTKIPLLIKILEQMIQDLEETPTR